MICRVCQVEKDASAFAAGSRRGCRDCVNAYHRGWRAKNPQKARAATARWKLKNREYVRDQRRLRVYGLSPQAFDQLLDAQSGLCPICTEPLGADAVVDHCHKTGAVRGILHRKCNAALGGFADDYTSIQRAASYLFQTSENQLIHPWAVIGDPPQHRDYRDTFAGIPPEIDPTVRIEAFVSVDAGIERPTSIGARSWVMKSVHVGHDTEIGEDCIVCPMTSIAGHVTIGNNVRIDQGVTIRPFVKVGDGARLGMGAVVVKDVPAGVTVVGNPARPLVKVTGDTLDCLRG